MEQWNNKNFLQKVIQWNKRHVVDDNTSIWWKILRLKEIHTTYIILLVKTREKTTMVINEYLMESRLNKMSMSQPMYFLIT